MPKPLTRTSKGTSGNDLRRADGSEVRGAISRADPKFSRSAVPCLKKEDSVVLVAAGSLTFWHLSTGKFCYLSHNSAIEAVFWSSFGHVTEHFDLAREPCIASPLDVVCDKSVKHREHQHRSDGKRQSLPRARCATRRFA